MYTLKPKSRSKKVKAISVGAFTWPIILQVTGAGYVLGYGAGRTPGSYVYKDGNIGSPSSNDGYTVTSEEAVMMAKVLHGYISVQRFVNKEWDAMPTDEKERLLNITIPDSGKLYRGYVVEERLKQYENIANFCELSKGFSIH